MKKAELSISALDSFDRDVIGAHCIWYRFDDAHLEWTKANNWGGRVLSEMPWKGLITTVPDGGSDADSLHRYAQELVKKHPEIHATVRDGKGSVSNYGAGVISMADILFS